MPRKQQPKVVDVLEYFESAPLDAARLALELAQRAVRKREPKLASEQKPKGSKAKDPGQAAPPAPTASTTKARGTGQAAPAGAPPAVSSSSGVDGGAVPAV